MPTLLSVWLHLNHSQITKELGGERASTAAPRGWQLRTKQWPQIMFGWVLVYSKPGYIPFFFLHTSQCSNLLVPCLVPGVASKAPRSAVWPGKAAWYSLHEGATRTANCSWLQEPVLGWDATFPGKCKEMQTAPPSFNQHAHLVPCW